MIADNKGWIIGITRKQVLSHGIIVSVGYGVITYQGLVYSFIGEVLRIHSLKDSPTYGMVVNLYRDTTMHVLVGALVLSLEIDSMRVLV